MKRAAHWLLAALLATVSVWALWAVLRPEMVHQLASLRPLC